MTRTLEPGLADAARPHDTKENILSGSLSRPVRDDDSSAHPRGGSQMAFASIMIPR